MPHRRIAFWLQVALAAQLLKRRQGPILSLFSPKKISRQLKMGGGGGWKFSPTGR